MSAAASAPVDPAVVAVVTSFLASAAVFYVTGTHIRAPSASSSASGGGSAASSSSSAAAGSTTSPPHPPQAPFPTTADPYACSLTVSTAHAIVSTALSARSWSWYWPLVLSSSPLLWEEDGLHERITGGVTLGYLLWDTVCGAAHTYWRVPTSEPMLNVGMVVHHLVSALTIWGALVSSYGVPLQALFIISEASTPFLNIHLTIRRDDPRRTANGLMMWITFFMGRIVLLSLIGRALVGTSVPRVTDRHPVLYWALIITVLPLFVLNWIWFWKITSGLLKVVFARPGARGPSSSSSLRAAADAEHEDAGETAPLAGGAGGGGGGGGKAERLETKHLDSPTAAPRSPSSRSPTASAFGKAAKQRV
jgi:hypothetical protein